MEIDTYCRSEIERLRAMEADELEALRRLAAEARERQQRVMAIRGGLTAYRDVLEQLKKGDR